jgi:hypothetical protein
LDFQGATRAQDLQEQIQEVLLAAGDFEGEEKESSAAHDVGNSGGCA